MTTVKVMDLSTNTEIVRGGIAIGGAVISVATLNTVVSVLTILYLLIVLWNSAPKVVETYRFWRNGAGSGSQGGTGGTCDGT